MISSLAAGAAESSAPAIKRLWAPGSSAALPLIVITLLAVALRFAHLGFKSLWLDEVASIVIARQNFSSVWSALHSLPANTSVFYVYMSLYYALLHFWLGLGNSEFLIRLPSAVFGIATVLLIYLAGKNIFSKRVGLAAALLLAVHPFHIEYSQEARSYALAIFFSVLSLYCFVKGTEDKKAGLWWVLYVFSAALAVYSHLFAILLLPAQWMSLFFMERAQRPLKKILLSVIAIAFLIAPVLFFAFTRDMGPIPWGARPHPREILHGIQLFTATGLKLPLYLALLGAAGVSLWRSKRLDGATHLDWRLSLLWACLVFPFAGVLLASNLKPPLFSRYFIFCLPASVLLAAFALCQIRPRPASNGAIVLFAALFIPSVFSYYAKPNEDWRGATAYLLADASPQDKVIFYQPYGRWPYEYYRARSRTPNAGPVLVEAAANGTLPDQIVPRIWIVLYGLHQQNLAEDVLIRKLQNALQNGRRISAHHSFEGINIVAYTNDPIPNPSP